MTEIHSCSYYCDRPECIKAQRDELRERLAQPEQEPVAWIQPNHLQKAMQAPFLCRVEPNKRMADFVGIYTAPRQRKPPQFPTMLRKMWSGAEVQKWINENWEQA